MINAIYNKVFNNETALRQQHLELREVDHRIIRKVIDKIGNVGFFDGYSIEEWQLIGEVSSSKLAEGESAHREVSMIADPKNRRVLCCVPLDLQDATHPLEVWAIIADIVGEVALRHTTVVYSKD
ncbi:MAG: hypothetical protein PHQ58_05030 [Rhodoferax sp.]|uniref:hypothetical protein n=1 Tax=Rhodoferax sp. TaxID=50421 RepID=UPI0026286212|nr:hypothetical protein [Rhodoferax sp.]MDD2879778.1 hypothetical protein [Rhodoferax sp.]